MKSATWLLAGAATLVIGGAAKAAPVEYVKVCDVNGAGFYYIPGTDTAFRLAPGGAYIADLNGDGDTDSNSAPSFQAAQGNGFTPIPGTDICIKVGGYLRAEGGFASFSGGGTATFLGGTVSPTVDTRTQTSYGTLRAYMAVNASVFHETIGSASETVTDVSLNRAFIQYAGFTFGKLSSNFDYAPGYAFAGREFVSSNNAWQARASLTLGGYAVDVSLEDQRDRDIDSTTPAFILGMSPSTTWNIRGSLAVQDTVYGLGTAVQIGTDFAATRAWTVRGTLAFAHNLPSYVGLSGAAPGNFFAGDINGKLNIAPKVDLVGDFGAVVETGGGSEWNFAAGVHWTPSTNLKLGGEFFYERSSAGFSDQGILLKAQYDFQAK